VRVVTAALVVVVVVALGTKAARADKPAELPDSLPPLDEKLAGEPAPPVAPFGQLRLRAELDDARDFTRDKETAAGVALTGRVGVDADVDGAHLVIVVGDGGRIGPPAVAPLLVARPALAALWQAELTLPVSIAGVAGAVDVGRMPVVVADGRLVGMEPFDARARTLDGLRLRTHTTLVDVDGALMWLGPDTTDAGDLTSAASALALLEGSLRPLDGVDVDVYGLLHRDGPDALTLPTLGARVSASSSIADFAVRARAGGDAQAPVADGANSFQVAGKAGHAEAGVAVAAPGLGARELSFFVDGGGEITAGDVVKGRVFRAPAPTQHDALGLLDLAAWDNTWSTALAVGATDKSGLAVDVGARVTGLVDPSGVLLDTAFHAVPERTNHGDLAFVEFDASLELPLSRDVALGVDYGVALPGSALIGNEPAQRLLVSIRASAAPFATREERDRILPPLP
jgi:hypothetical protein